MAKFSYQWLIFRFVDIMFMDICLCIRLFTAVLQSTTITHQAAKSMPVYFLHMSMSSFHLGKFQL